MAQAALRHLLLGVAASGLLMGCVAGSGDGTDGGASAASTARLATGGETGREVEAPDVFQTTDTALWDGRPSLGGIWVASPDAVDPERVVMVNVATGKSVTGALFRRERDNPGPTLQVSSDAAEALGMLAGQPTELRVTALRREEPVAEAEPAPIAEALPETATETPEPSAEPTEAEALAAAALDATGTAAATVDPATATEEEPARKTWKERRAEAKAKREAEKAAAAEAEAAAAAAAAGATDPVDPAASAVATVETAPLDAGAPAAAAPAATAPLPEAPVVEAPASTGAARTIQIASFSKEENATRAVEALSKIDIQAEIRKSDRNGTPFWGVVARGDAALLSKIRDAGFADAYFLQ